MTIQADLEKQKRLEWDIKSTVNRIKSLKSLERKVLRADDLHRKIQSDLADLERLDRQNYSVPPPPNFWQARVYKTAKYKT